MHSMHIAQCTLLHVNTLKHNFFHSIIDKTAENPMYLFCYICSIECFQIGCLPIHHRAISGLSPGVGDLYTVYRQQIREKVNHEKNQIPLMCTRHCAKEPK